MTDPLELIGPTAPDVMVQAVEDDLIVFDPQRDEYYTLNRTAREVWELADGTRTAETITRVLAERYEIDPAVIVPDVSAIIAHLTAAKLI